MIPSSFYKAHDGLPVTERARRVYESTVDLLESKKAKPEDFSLKNLGLAMGVLDPYDIGGSFRQTCYTMHKEGFNTEFVTDTRGLFQESNPGLLSGAFALLATTLLSAKAIEGYDSASGLVADSLVDHQTSNHRFNKMAGLTALTGGAKIDDGHPYPETDFSTKWVSTYEEKYGRMLSISELAIQEDNTGMILQKAKQLGEYLRQSREIEMINKIADTNSDVYRPSGSATALYASGNQNLIGTSGVSGWTSAIALTDWTDIDEVKRMRATAVKDDRIDGTQRPIADLMGPATLLCPYALNTTANYIRTAEKVITTPGATTGSAMEFPNPHRNSFDVVSSVYLDTLSTTTWYYGQFNKQFVWTTIFPLQTFIQGAGSEAAFERDVGLRVKVRYLGGLNAKDTVYVTKVLGS